MNKRQKIVQQQFIGSEERVIKRLKQVYAQALKDINGKIEMLMARRDADLQHVIYQVEYQKALKKQIQAVLDSLQADEFATVAEYLAKCYEDGFIGTLFDLQGQGIPLCFPMDQEAVTRAVQLDSKISQGLYTRLGEDIAVLKKKITAQVSRGIATGIPFQQVAQQLAGYTNIGYNNAIRIARTEGHRIQVQSSADAAYKARDKGADVVKQWDSTLDGKTRPSHRRVDGEIRELDEPFSNGLMQPGDPAGGAAEVVNCRCAYLQRAKWAADSGFSKRDNFTKELRTFADPKDYAEFKKWYFSDENVKYMKYVDTLEKRYGTKDFKTILSSMTEREYNHFKALEAASPMWK